jgi:hypothetical protein
MLAPGAMSNKTTESATTTIMIESSHHHLPTKTGINEEPMSQCADDTVESPSNLPPMDRGRGAWLFLTAAFTVEFLTIGPSLSPYSIRSTPFHTHPSY